MSGKTKVIAEPGAQTIHITRTFDYPREKVFKALVDPELIPQWMGPAKYKTEITKHEPRTGGEWRFVHTAAGEEYGFHGSYHEVTAPSRVVQTFEFEGMPGHVSLETLTLEEKDGQTLMTVDAVYQTPEDRDGMVASGMEAGISEGHDRLDDVLKEMV